MTAGGDEMDVQAAVSSNAAASSSWIRILRTILLRKHQPLTQEQCAALLECSRSQPEPTADDEAVVAETIREVRASRR